jgi:hypothetical protein
MQGYASSKTIPESFPPDKAVVTRQGQGANIIMECSTNLSKWGRIIRYLQLPAVDEVSGFGPDCSREARETCLSDSRA